MLFSFNYRFFLGCPSQRRWWLPCPSHKHPRTSLPHGSLNWGSERQVCSALPSSFRAAENKKLQFLENTMTLFWRKKKEEREMKKKGEKGKRRMYKTMKEERRGEEEERRVRREGKGRGEVYAKCFFCRSHNQKT